MIVARDPGAQELRVEETLSSTGRISVFNTLLALERGTGAENTITLSKIHL